MPENTDLRWLNAEQEARAEALRVAREVLRKGNTFSASVEVDVPGLVDVAVYVVAGTHPMDRYADEWSWPGDEPCEAEQDSR